VLPILVLSQFVEAAVPLSTIVATKTPIWVSPEAMVFDTIVHNLHMTLQVGRACERSHAERAWRTLRDMNQHVLVAKDVCLIGGASHRRLEKTLLNLVRLHNDLSTMKGIMKDIMDIHFGPAITLGFFFWVTHQPPAGYGAISLFSLAISS